jgi:site-specific DNA recombinase
MDKEYTKAVIYCRVSTEKQVTDGNGLDSQEHRCREYASSLGLEVDNVFRDEGISGGLFDRPAMKALIKYLDSNWHNKYIVIFDDLKRFARDVEVHLKLKAELRAREAKIRCLNYNFDDSAEGEFVETIFAAQNQLERKQNRRQVCQKMKSRIERGYWCFGAPTGYEYKKDKEHGKLLMPVQPIADIISEGMAAFAENRLKRQVDLQNFFISKGLPSLLGKKTINLELVNRILTQPLYTGFVEFQEWEISKRPGKHKALISEELYQKIQNKLKRPERLPRETDNLEFPLRRVISCAVCGKKMTGSVSKGKRKYYAHYTCNNKECKANPKNIAANKLEEDYIKLLESIKVDPELLEMIKAIAIKIWTKKVQMLNMSQKAKETEIKELENQINDYIDLMPATKLESVRVRYEAKIEELDSQVKELKKGRQNKKDPNFEEALGLVLRFLGTPAETWRKLSRELKIMVHNMIFEENPKYSLETGFGTPKLSLPFSLKDIFLAKKSSMVDLPRIELGTEQCECPVIPFNYRPKKSLLVFIKSHFQLKIHPQTVSGERSALSRRMSFLRENDMGQTGRT